MAMLDLDKVVKSGSSSLMAYVASWYEESKNGYSTNAMVDFKTRFIDNKWTVMDIDGNLSSMITLPDTTERANEIASLVVSRNNLSWNVAWYLKMPQNGKLLKVTAHDSIGGTVSAMGMTNIWSVAVGSNPHWIAIADGYAYVTNCSSGTVSKIEISGLMEDWVYLSNLRINWELAYQRESIVTGWTAAVSTEKYKNVDYISINSDLVELEFENMMPGLEIKPPNFTIIF